MSDDEAEDEDCEVDDDGGSENEASCDSEAAVESGVPRHSGVSKRLRRTRNQTADLRPHCSTINDVEASPTPSEPVDIKSRKRINVR